MNYYIQGNAADAEKIKAAFEKLGYSTSLHTFFDEDTVFITLNGNICECNYGGAINELIKTHPDYKELELPVQPKFKVGDWIACDADSFTLSIKSVRDENYYFHQGASLPIKEVDEHYHLWTIADAKDGDVLSTNSIICIFKKLDKDGYYIISPCIYTVKDGLEVIDDEDDSIGSYGFKPATKEDRELLFRKMKEAGYEWDADKKELKKIQPHYDIANFKPFDKVLVRDNDRGKWRASIFSYHIKGRQTCYPFCCIGNSFSQCIPFEGNEALLGTTDMPSEEYINW